MSRPNSYVIDFGAWVGPTAMFASSYAKHVYALEPDPGAYSELYWNIMMNPHIAQKTSLFQLCISDSRAPLTMFGFPAGSMVTMHNRTGSNDHQQEGFATFTVACMTLDDFLQEQQIPPEEIGLIKIDTEV
jgi:FkbM family methyltransferase